MSKPLYSSKLYRHLDVSEDLPKSEDHEEERRILLPPQAHASSSPSSISSIISSPIPSRKLPSDVSFIPIGVDYSTSDAINHQQRPFPSHFQHDRDILELPRPVCSVIDISYEGRKEFQVTTSRGSRRDLLRSPVEIELLSSSNPHTSPHPIRSTDPPSFSHSSQSERYHGGHSVPSSHRNSPLYGNSVREEFNKGIPYSGVPGDLTVWEAMTRRPTSPILQNRRRSLSPPTFTQPQISTKPFSFSPLPTLLPPFNPSLLPLHPTRNFGTSSTTALPAGIIQPSATAIPKHSTSNNNDNVSLDLSTQGFSSIFSNFSSTNSSPSSSRCATPTNISIGRSASPPKTFMIPGCNLPSQPNSNVGSNKRSHNKSVSASMVPDYINAVSEEMANKAMGGKSVSDNLLAAGSIENQSKYNQLLALIRDMEKDIRPSYACSKSSIERLKREINHGRLLIREALVEIERSSQRSNSEEREMYRKYPKMN